MRAFAVLARGRMETVDLELAPEGSNSPGTAFQLSGVHHMLLEGFRV